MKRVVSWIDPKDGELHVLVFNEDGLIFEHKCAWFEYCFENRPYEKSFKEVLEYEKTKRKGGLKR